MVSNRIILHVDLDCFFAAVEIRDDPELKGRPVIIGADPKQGTGRGVISTCSYEAREYGLHSAMPISIAYKKCPHGVYLRPHINKYKVASDKVMEVLSSYSEYFQIASIDEAYLDVSMTCNDYNDAKKMAESIQADILKHVGITCSIGVAATKTIAKIASDYRKPNGITLVEPSCIRLFLKRMDITRIPGIGKKSKNFYYKHGIKQIGDIYNIGRKQMRENFGKHGDWAWIVSNGLDNRPVCEKHDRKSIGKERTFREDTQDYSFIMDQLVELNKRLHVKMQNLDIRYKTITLKIRFRGFETYTRAKSLPTAIRDKDIAQYIIEDLISEFKHNKKLVRLAGVKFSNLEKYKKEMQVTLNQFLVAFA